MEECELRRQVLGIGIACDEDRCFFWAHLGPDDPEIPSQCAIKYFSMLGDSGKELAEWLLSLKDRADIAQILGLDTAELAEE
jgi:hypothetical protein